jgi:hypothetical protein
MQIGKILRGLVGIVIFAIVVMSIAIIGFLHFDPLCGEEIVQELRSPDGRTSPYPWNGTAGPQRATLSTLT